MTAKKFDDGKPPMHLLDKEALFETARVLAFGAQKYSEDNWRGGGEYTLGTKRPIAAAIRHLYQYLDGERNDDESGLGHLAHAMCEVMFALAADLRGKSDVAGPCEDAAPDEAVPQCEYCGSPSAGKFRHCRVGSDRLDLHPTERVPDRYLCASHARQYQSWRRLETK